MKKIIFLFAMMLAVVTASADRKYAKFVAPSGNGSYDSENCIYSWTDGSNNLMTVFTFSDGELANYKYLKVVRLGGSFTNSWRANVLYNDNTNQSFIWYNYNDKSIDLSDGTWGGTALSDGKTLSDIKAIRIGGQNSTGSVVIDETCVYLENDNDAVVTAAFAKPASSATYTKTIYNATAGNNNLMDCYTKATDGDFTKYGKLQFEIQNVSGLMRIGFHDGSNFSIIGSTGGYGGGGVKNIDLSSHSDAASSATTIKFGSKDNAGSVTILPTKMLLIRKEAYDREFTADNVSTLWLPFTLTAEEAAEAGDFYELTGFSGTTLNFTKVTGATVAYKPYIFKAKATGTPFSAMKEKQVVAPTSCSYTVDNATFVGSMKDMTVPEGSFGYKDNVFKKVGSNVTIAPFRAYFVIESAGSQSLDINFVEDATGIEEVEAQQADVKEDGIAYNLAGVPVGKDYKGIVIVNGKKIMQ